jgi:hypothetical protein
LKGLRKIVAIAPPFNPQANHGDGATFGKFAAFDNAADHKSSTLQIMK